MAKHSVWSKTALFLILAAPGFGTQRPLHAQEVTQREHDRAKASQDAHDKRHHNTAKTVGGTAAAGTVIGALAGGGKGALIGGAAGAGTGVVADKVRKHKGVTKRARREHARDTNPR